MTPKKADPKEFKEKCEKLVTLIGLYLLGSIDLRYGDETAFSLEPNVPYCWTREGEQKGIPSRKGGKLNVFGLMNLAGNLTTYQSTGSVDAQQVVDWLDDFASTIEKQTVVVLDNAPWHTAEKVEEKIEEWEATGLYIFRLPVYSPHLNLIETLWRKVKNEWLRPKDYESKEVLHERINYIFKNYNSSEFNIDFTIKLSS